MLSFLKNHPFAVEAFFKHSMVLTFAVPKGELARLIPPCLELDTFEDAWAFVAVALVQTTDLRPKGFSKLFGTDFFLIGYRIFVTYRTSAGKRLRGLYILKSETDKRRMAVLGNLFTHYHYSITDIKQQGNTIRSTHSGLMVEAIAETDEVSLPSGSPFKDWREARRFAGPLPFTFTYTGDKREVLIIEGVREHWTPRPVAVKTWAVSFVDRFEGARLASAFVIENIPYYWKKGKLEVWNP